MKHTFSVLVENKFGVLARVAGLFAARGFNIESLAVSPTNDPTVSHMTIVVDAPDERILEQIKKQLNKLVDTIKVQDLTTEDFIDRELVLVKIAVDAKIRPQILEIAQSLEAKIDEAAANAVTLEVVGDKNKIHTLLQLLKTFEIKEVVRTGRIAMSRK
ncbi:MAG: acetolactate synthase small subunit [Candidatus Omnitrophota bacterium]|nr:MAG: acetolactate synthase small subunit [Candidatus Omnitrophota bacterium]